MKNKTSFHFESDPASAWVNYLRHKYFTPNWIEDSRDISTEVPLSNRELFALIILAYARSGTNSEKVWNVGFDSNASEPNDGFIHDGNQRIDVESKLVAQMERKDVLDAILSTYQKYKKRGKAYGKNRSLVIFGNKPTRGLIKVSSLHDLIEEDCPFDQVLLMHACTIKVKEAQAIMHITQHYPAMELTQVDFNIVDGTASVPSSRINWDI